MESGPGRGTRPLPEIPLYHSIALPREACGRNEHISRSVSGNGTPCSVRRNRESDPALRFSGNRRIRPADPPIRSETPATRSRNRPRPETPSLRDRTASGETARRRHKNIFVRKGGKEFTIPFPPAGSLRTGYRFVYCVTSTTPFWPKYCVMLPYTAIFLR